MNFLLKSISNFQFPYSIEDEIILQNPFWVVQCGIRKCDSLPVTIFTHTRQPNNTNDEKLIQNALHKFKVLKLPGLIRVIEIIDNNQPNLYIITERVWPLSLKKLVGLSQDAKLLGLYQLIITLDIIHTQANVILGTLSIGNIFINDFGEWIIFGLELCCYEANPDHFIENVEYYSTRVSNSLWEIPSVDIFQSDFISLGSLFEQIHEPMLPSWRELITNLVRKKLTFSHFFVQAKKTLETQSSLILIYNSLKELHIENFEKKKIVMLALQDMIINEPQKLENSTPGFVNGLIIPELSRYIRALMTESTHSTQQQFMEILSFIKTVFDLTCNSMYQLELDDAFNKFVKPLICDNFKSDDRKLRFLLLIYFPKYIDKLSNSEISEKIFPQLIRGLTDSDSLLRLQTLKKISLITDKITERQLNNELLRYLAKTQMDSEVEIRTWTILTITTIGNSLSPTNNRAGILATAFTKSLKDLDIKPRLAALYGLMKSLELFDAETIANKILMVIAPSLLDINHQVRSSAKELFKTYSKKLEVESDKIKTNNEMSMNFDFDFILSDSENKLELEFLATLKIPSSNTEGVFKTEENKQHLAEDGWNDFDDFDDFDIKSPISDDISDFKTYKNSLNSSKSIGESFKQHVNMHNNVSDDGACDVTKSKLQNMNESFEKPNLPTNFKSSIKPKNVVLNKLKKLEINQSRYDDDDYWGDEW